MNDASTFEAWAARARQESAPSLDIAASVLRRIEATEPRREVGQLWLVCGGVSMVAASLMLVAAVSCWQVLTDPLAGLFTSLVMVMQ